jgi:hypothetical protein
MGIGFVSKIGSCIMSMGFVSSVIGSGVDIDSDVDGVSGCVIGISNTIDDFVNIYLSKRSKILSVSLDCKKNI